MKGVRKMLIGEYSHNVDAKGRVFIPAKYRADLGSSFVVTKSADGSIRAHTAKSWERYVNALSGSTAEVNKLRRRICSSAIELEMDSQGRVMLPETLRKHAVITDKVQIVGMLDWIEFWNPEKYEAVNGDMSEEMEMQMLSELNLG